MSTVGNKQTSLPSSSIGTNVTRTIRNIIDTSSQLASIIREDKIDQFLPTRDGTSKEDFREKDIAQTKKVAENKKIHDQRLAGEANKAACELLTKVSLLLDPDLISFVKKGIEGQSPQQAQKTISENINKLAKGPDNVKTLQHVAAQISQKISSTKKSNSKDTVSDDRLSDEEIEAGEELLADIQSVIDSGSHENLQALLTKLKDVNPKLLTALKPEIKNYEKNLAALFKAEQRNITNFDQAKDYIQNIVGDKALRNALAKLGGQILDQKGGIFCYNDTDVTWHLAAYEYKPGVDDGRTVTDLSIRRLLPGEVAGKTTGYTHHLTEDQPTYNVMQQA